MKVLKGEFDSLLGETSTLCRPDRGITTGVRHREEEGVSEEEEENMWLISHS